MAYLITGDEPRPVRQFAERLADRRRLSMPPTGRSIWPAPTTGWFAACSTEVLERPDLVTDPRFATAKARSANKEKLRAIIADIFASDSCENWMAKMKKANVPVGLSSHCRGGLQCAGSARPPSPQPDPASDRRLGAQYRVAADYGLDAHYRSRGRAALGEHTKDVLRKTLGYDDRRIAALAEAGGFGKTGNSG